MVVMYFKKFSHKPLMQLVKESEDKLQDVKKSKQSLTPFSKHWAALALKKKSKSQTEIIKETDQILTAFVQANLDFDAISDIYVKSREMPRESRNFTFVNDVTLKLKPYWELYGPSGVDILSVLDVLCTMGDWLFPDPEPDIEVMPLIINSKKPKEPVQVFQRPPVVASGSRSNLVQIPTLPEEPDIIEVVSTNFVLFFGGKNGGPLYLFFCFQ